MWHPFKFFSKKPSSPAKRSSQPDYDRLVKVIAAMADQGASGDHIQVYLQNRELTPAQVAQWVTQYGGKWVTQPEAEFGQQLLSLSKLTEGELAHITQLLGRAILDRTGLPAPLIEPQKPLSETNAEADEAAQKTNQIFEPDPEILAEIEAYLQGDRTSDYSNSFL
jgi:hypothetical protein